MVERRAVSNASNSCWLMAQLFIFWCVFVLFVPHSMTMMKTAFSYHWSNILRLQRMWNDRENHLTSKPEGIGPELPIKTIPLIHTSKTEFVVFLHVCLSLDHILQFAYEITQFVHVIDSQNTSTYHTFFRIVPLSIALRMRTHYTHIRTVIIGLSSIPFLFFLPAISHVSCLVFSRSAILYVGY